jgi:KH/beta-lactamase-domain protein
MDILKDIQKELPRNVVSSANFEGANIVLYTDSPNFFLEGESQIKEIVNKIKKRIELRAESKLLESQEKTEKIIKDIIPKEAEITAILFDSQRSIVVIESKKPGLVIGRDGSILREIKQKTFWIPQVQRSPAIDSKITENIRAVLYENNNYRKKLLNDIGKKIYEEWNPEKIEEWVRLSFLGAGRQVGRSCILLSTPQSKILLDCGIDAAASKNEDKFPYLDVPEFKIDEIDAIILSHAHLDHSGLIFYLFKMGYKGPIYMTAPTRDTSALLALDFIGVAYKQAAKPLFSSTDIKEMVKHTICLNFNEVTDIAPDIRITLYNAGHILGSAMIHINIGNGLHNFLYTGDFKFGKTRLLNPANSLFPRLETAMIESTYGSKDDIVPAREDLEKQLIEKIKEVINRKGKVLIPELGSGRAQETMLVLDEAMKKELIPKVPIYIDGMIWDINAIHTAYPDFLNSTIRQQIFQGENPFVSDTFQRVGSPTERKEVIEGGPCIVLATSGMLVGGASVEYFREFASNRNNCILFVCYQGSGSLGRLVQEGLKELEMQNDGMKERVEVKLEVFTLYGFTSHSGRNELLAFMNRCSPRPKRVIINHGEQSKCLDLASTIYKLNHCETNTPRNLETLRLR